MEDYLGLIGGKPSRVKSIVLRQNGIRTRYYGLDKDHKMTYSNAQLAKEAVRGLFPDKMVPSDVTLLACGTSTPDQLLPSHASMVHGELGNFPMEIFSSAGVCLTSLQALKICYSNILAGLHKKAVCVASELTSPALVAKFYDPEYEATHDNPEKDPYMQGNRIKMSFLGDMEKFEEITSALDPRVKGRCKHKVSDIIIIAIATYLCGGDRATASNFE